MKPLLARSVDQSVDASRSVLARVRQDGAVDSVGLEVHVADDVHNGVLRDAGGQHERDGCVPEIVPAATRVTRLLECRGEVLIQMTGPKRFAPERAEHEIPRLPIAAGDLPFKLLLFAVAR